MTRFVLVSDIHSNYPALKKVVESEGKDAQYLILGDLLGLNAFPKETIDLVRSLDAVTLIGNHDRAIIIENEGHVNNKALSEFELQHTIEQLTDDDIEWISSLPHFQELEVDNKSICLTHAKPYPTEASGYKSGNAGIRKGNVPHFASDVADRYDYVFHGHTHTAYSLDCERFGHDVQFVNPGSIGYDGTYAIVDIETGYAEIKTVEYDEEDLKEHIQSMLPEKAPSVHRWY